MEGATKKRKLLRKLNQLSTMGYELVSTNVATMSRKEIRKQLKLAAAERRVSAATQQQGATKMGRRRKISLARGGAKAKSQSKVMERLAREEVRQQKLAVKLIAGQHEMHHRPPPRKRSSNCGAASSCGHKKKRKK